MRGKYLALIFIVLVSSSFRSYHPVTVEDLSSLLSKFVPETDLVRKEYLLNEIIRHEEAGPQLLCLAMNTNDVVTKWMSIRGIGFMKYEDAAPFLLESLKHRNPYVRANAAMALGQIKSHPASSKLIALLYREKDGGVIEQTSLALQRIEAKNAVPALKKAMLRPSTQTRCWVLQAIGHLGSKNELPFLATYLYDHEPTFIVGMCAAQAIEEITGEDFGFPKQSGPMSPQPGVERARQWWEANKRTAGKNI